MTLIPVGYHERFLNEEVPPGDVAKELISALIVISAGIRDVAQLGVPAEKGLRRTTCCRCHRVATGWTAAGLNVSSQTSEPLNVTNRSSTESGDER